MEGEKAAVLRGAGLGDAQQVAALEQSRNSLTLDRRRVRITLRLKRTQQRLGEAEIGKIGHELP